MLPTNVFIKSDGPRIVLPLVQPPADGAGTAEDRFYNYFTLDHWMPMQLTTMTGCSTTCSKEAPGVAWGPGSFLLYTEFGYPDNNDFADDYFANPLVFSPEVRVYSNIYTLADAFRAFVFALCHYLTASRPANAPAANIDAVVAAANVVMLFNFVLALVTESAALMFMVKGNQDRKCLSISDSSTRHH
jgi:hypothetical protein